MKSTLEINFFWIVHLLGISLFVCASLADAWHCDVAPLAKILESNPHITYIACQPETSFIYEKLPFEGNHYLHPSQGTFKETFIITIAHGQVFGREGWVLVQDTTIHELIWQNIYLAQYCLDQAKNNPLIQKAGRVAVITQPGYGYYYHWMVEVLGRLALLEMQGIEYDYVYAPLNAPYMKETLQLWGIDSSKIIQASDEHLVTAEVLLVPSLVSHATVDGCPRLVHYIPRDIVQYIVGAK